MTVKSFFNCAAVSLLALPGTDGEQGPNLLYPVRALRVYIEHSESFRQMEQLFVCFGGCSKELPVTKQRLSHWIVDAIALAYASAGLQCPIGVRAHFTRGMPPLGPGPVESLLGRFVLLPAGHRRLPLLDSTIWMSCLLNIYLIFTRADEWNTPNKLARPSLAVGPTLADGRPSAWCVPAFMSSRPQNVLGSLCGSGLWSPCWVFLGWACRAGLVLHLLIARRYCMRSPHSRQWRHNGSYLSIENAWDKGMSVV